MNNAQNPINNLITYYIGGDGDNNMVSHSDMAELITLVYILYNGCGNQGELLRKIDAKCNKHYSEEKLLDYTEMINNKQIRLNDAVKELFTLDDLEFYGI